MYSKFQHVIKWVQYYIKAENSHGHGVHSPFVFDFINNVLGDENYYYAYEPIERLKKKLLNDRRTIDVEDLGAVSTDRQNIKKQIAEIAGSSVSSEKFGRLLFRLANYYQAKSLIEMGTSLGISTAYLASANEKSDLITMEGSNTIAEIAGQHFKQLELKNIKQINGHFDHTLSTTLDSLEFIDFAFIDGNHRKEPVVNYFNQIMTKIASSSAIVIHDIHWSEDMEKAWKIIRSDPRVNMSIDLFSAGIIFFREEFKIKQDFIIRF